MMRWAIFPYFLRRTRKTGKTENPGFPCRKIRDSPAGKSGKTGKIAAALSCRETKHSGCFISGICHRQ